MPTGWLPFLISIHLAFCKLTTSRRLLLNSTEVVVHDVGNIRPEGIDVISSQDAQTLFGVQTESSFALYSELLYGGINGVNLETGEKFPFAERTGYGERVAVALRRRAPYVLVVGGGAQLGGAADSLLVFDDRGSLIATCKNSDSTRLLMDVAVLGDVAFVTDALVSSLFKVNLTQAVAEGSNCLLDSVDLPSEQFTPQVEGDFMAVGVVAYGNGLLIATASTGALYYFDAMSEETAEVLPAGTIPGVYGMATDGEFLYLVNVYIVNVRNETLNVYKIRSSSGGAPDVTFDHEIESESFDHPLRASVDLDGSRVWVANTRVLSTDFPGANESNLDIFEERFQIIGAPRRPPTNEPTASPITISPTASPVPQVSAFPSTVSSELPFLSPSAVGVVNLSSETPSGMLTETPTMVPMENASITNSLNPSLIPPISPDILPEEETLSESLEPTRSPQGKVTSDPSVAPPSSVCRRCISLFSIVVGCLVFLLFC